ncbi:receptor activity-modifying protein 1 isoform X1 [Pelobates fuscus]|uniref:receptor activity-modifying protein 1 isoform X1 n=3 Tax=Pelobates fuscus TaxID=191477 RepID=UPI002FE4A4FB
MQLFNRTLIQTDMNLGFFFIPRHLLWILLAPPLMSVAGCDEAIYTSVMNEFCLQHFELEMEVLGKSLWCDWGDTAGFYTDVTNCTALVAAKLGCFWPNHLVDHLFIGIHKKYFRNCSVTGRLPADPPFPILCSLLFIPLLITLLMTALVVWRSKRSEGIV